MMRYIAPLLALTVAGCAPRTQDPPVPPRQPVICKGHFLEISSMMVQIQCEDGRVATYRTYKYSFKIDETNLVK